DADALERPLGPVARAQGHEAGHLLFGQPDLLPTPLRQRQVLDGEGRAGGGVGGAFLERRGPHRAWFSRVVFRFGPCPERAPVRTRARFLPAASSSSGPCASVSAGSGRTTTSASPASPSHPRSTPGSNPGQTCPISSW